MMMHGKRNLLFLIIVALWGISCSSEQTLDQAYAPTAPNTPTSTISPSPKVTFSPNTPSHTLTLTPTPTEGPLQTAAPIPLYTPTQTETCGHLPPDRSIYLDEYPAFSIRQGPGCEYEEFQGKINKPNPITFLDVLGKHGDWLLVDLCNGMQGWVFGPAIDRMNLEVEMDDLPLLTPAPPSMTLPTSPPQNKKEAIDQASKTLVTFFDLLYNKKYEQATKLFGGGYGVVINWNSDVDPDDYPALLMKGCEWNGFVCSLRIGKIIEAKQISPMEYHFIVEFIKDDGSLYQRRGANDTTVSQFLFRVARDCNGEYFVVDWPFYEQYGG
jgi:hypothetical protein